MKPRLLSFAASFRCNSSNQQLVDLAAVRATHAGASVVAQPYTRYDAPLLRDDISRDATPEGVAHFVADITACDGLLLAMPEYNWSIPGALKNLLDWASLTPDILKHKTALLMCASPSVRGGIMGLQQLRVPLEHLGMWVYPQVIGVGKAHAALQHGEWCSAKDRQFLEQCVDDFVRVTAALT
jgi:chromate reductase, NAD(P)H dehydrogenase (quinone)